MFLKRSRWWLRKEQLSPCRSITSCTSQCQSPSSPCSVLVALHLPLADHHSRSPHSLLVLLLHCLFLRNQRSLLLNSNLRQLTFMRLDIPVQPHSYVQWAKGQKPPHTPRSPSPTCNGLQRSLVSLHSFTTDIFQHLQHLCTYWWKKLQKR